MTRWIVLLGCVFALALSVPIGTEAYAAKRSKSCVATGMDGKQTKWRCRALEKCCYDWWSGKGRCVPASAMCLF